MGSKVDLVKALGIAKMSSRLECDTCVRLGRFGRELGWVIRIWSELKVMGLGFAKVSGERDMVR